MNIDTNYIIPYLQGTLTPKEKEEVRLYMESCPEFKKEVEDTLFILNLTDELKQQRSIDVSSNWKRLSARISFQLFRQKVWNITRTSAAVLLPLLIIYQYIIPGFKDTPEEVVEQVEIMSAYGLVSEVILPDGSTVWLNSGSRLVYPKYFSGAQRTVQLSGEAYFRVKSGLSDRFDVVVPDGMVVSAYGTEFNVNAYEDDPQIEVVLSKGHIEVNSLRSVLPKHLLVGQQAVLYKGAKDIEISEANVYAQTAWKDGKMVFRRAKMNEIVKKLARHFNVTIELRGRTLYEYEYNATFTTETLNEILHLLEQSAPIEWKSVEPDKRSDLSYAKRKVIISVKDRKNG